MTHKLKITVNSQAYPNPVGFVELDLSVTQQLKFKPLFVLPN